LAHLGTEKVKSAASLKETHFLGLKRVGVNQEKKRTGVQGGEGETSDTVFQGIKGSGKKQVLLWGEGTHRNAKEDGTYLGVFHTGLEGPKEGGQEKKP